MIYKHGVGMLRPNLTERLMKNHGYSSDLNLNSTPDKLEHPSQALMPEEKDEDESKTPEKTYYNPIFRDIAVVARGYGEFSSKTCVDANDEKTLDRLESSIKQLMTLAEKDHNDSTLSSNLDYMTRLSTNECFFYTKAPLELKEFEELQNRLYDHAERLSNGIQFILGSFAIKTDDNTIMNVTPHITGGARPVFKFLVKRITSSVDPRYQIPGGNGKKYELYNPCKKVSPSSQLSISLRGVAHPFTTGHILACKTPRGTPFLTLVEICIEHFGRSALSQFQNLDLRSLGLSIFKKVCSYPVSQVVVANSTALEKISCIGSSVMHVDPDYSPYQCKEGATQEKDAVTLDFGPNRANRCFVYRVEPKKVSQLKNTYTYIENKKNKHGYTVSSLSSLTMFKSIKGNQKPIYIAGNEKLFNKYYANLSGDSLKAKILENLENAIQEVGSLEALKKLEREIMTSLEYYTLKQPQDWFTRKTGINPSSITALNKMLKQKEDYIIDYDSRFVYPQSTLG